MRTVSLLHFAAIIAVIGAAARQPDPRGFAMPWICFDRCGTTIDGALTAVEQLMYNKDVVDVVTFDYYTVSSDGELISNSSLHAIPPLLKAANFTTVPIVWVTDPAVWFQLVLNKTVGLAFLQTLDANLAAAGMDGVSFHFEPPVDVTASQHGTSFAYFVATARKVLGGGRSGAFVAVELASWTDMWTYTELVTAMTNGADTTKLPRGYVTPLITFDETSQVFSPNVAFVASLLGNSSTNVVAALSTGTSSELTKETTVARHMAEVAEHGWCHIGVWKAPMPSFWFPLLRQFSRRCGFLE